MKIFFRQSLSVFFIFFIFFSCSNKTKSKLDIESISVDEYKYLITVKKSGDESTTRKIDYNVFYNTEEEHLNHGFIIYNQLQEEIIIEFPLSSNYDKVLFYDWHYDNNEGVIAPMEKKYFNFRSSVSMLKSHNDRANTDPMMLIKTKENNKNLATITINPNLKSYQTRSSLWGFVSFIFKLLIIVFIAFSLFNLIKDIYEGENLHRLGLLYHFPKWKNEYEELKKTKQKYELAKGDWNKQEALSSFNTTVLNLEIDNQKGLVKNLTGEIAKLNDEIKDMNVVLTKKERIIEENKNNYLQIKEAVKLLVSSNIPKDISYSNLILLIHESKEFRRKDLLLTWKREIGKGNAKLILEQMKNHQGEEFFLTNDDLSEIDLMKARLSRVKKDENSGRESSEKIRQELNKIDKALIDFIREIEQNKF